MSYSRYLTSVLNCLRDEVAPAVGTAEARDSLGACLRTLAALTGTFERVEHPTGNNPDMTALPADLAREFGDFPRTPSAGLVLPTRTVADDLPGGTAWWPQVNSAAQWLQSLTPQTLDRHAPVVRALLEWEQGLRQEQIHAMDACVQVTASRAAEPSGSIAIDREQLQAYLRRHFHVPGLEIADFRVIVGGRSRQTVLFTISATPGVPPHLVCQRDHPANINPQGSVITQYALLHYLHESGLKVPRPVLFETGRSALGAPFVITEKVPGTTVIDAATEYYAAPPRSARLASSLATQMGRLHGLAQAPVKDNLRTTLADGAGWDDEVARLRKCWHEQATGPSVVVEAALAWLGRNVECVTDRKAIVHTDMLLHNILVENGEVSAVLDWEIAHIGHPAEDLGYVRPVVEQMTHWSTFMSAYIAAGGAQISQRETDWFSLRALVHLATLAQFSRNRLDSNASNDIRVAETGASWLPRLKERLATLLLSILPQ